MSIAVVDVKQVWENGNFVGGNFRLHLPEGSTDPKVWLYGPLREFVERYHVVLMAGYEASKAVEGILPYLTDSDKSDCASMAGDVFYMFPKTIDDKSPSGWLEQLQDEDMKVQLSDSDENAREELAKAYTQWVRARARILVSVPAHGHAIRVLAQNLRENEKRKEWLTGPEAHDIIASAIGEFGKLGTDKP
jgi:hypothetical protein